MKITIDQVDLSEIIRRMEHELIYRERSFVKINENLGGHFRDK
jgi:hypothetical protein